MKLIDKDKVVAEIENKLQDLIACKENALSTEKRVVLWAKIDMCNEILSFLDTLEVKEVYEHNDSDLDSILEGIGVEHDSKLAKMFKTAFYNGIDTYLAQKGE